MAEKKQSTEYTDSELDAQARNGGKPTGKSRA